MSIKNCLNPAVKLHICKSNRYSVHINASNHNLKPFSNEVNCTNNVKKEL